MNVERRGIRRLRATHEESPVLSSRSITLRIVCPFLFNYRSLRSIHESLSQSKSLSDFLVVIASPPSLSPSLSLSCSDCLSACLSLALSICLSGCLVVYRFHFDACISSHFHPSISHDIADDVKTELEKA